MNPFLENFYQLYGDDETKVIHALQSKKTWIFRKFYLPGHFQPTFDRMNEKHYPSLERLLDQVVHFRTIRYQHLKFLKEDEKNLFENALVHLKVLTLFDHPEDNEKHPFWIEYDLTKIDKDGYQDLGANLFPSVSKESVEESYPSSALAHMLKYALIDDIGRYKLIVDQQVLHDSCYYLPLASKIIYDEQLDPMLIEVLKSIAKTLNIESEAY